MRFSSLQSDVAERN